MQELIEQFAKLNLFFLFLIVLKVMVEVSKTGFKYKNSIQSDPGGSSELDFHFSKVPNLRFWVVASWKWIMWENENWKSWFQGRCADFAFPDGVFGFVFDQKNIIGPQNCFQIKK